MSTATSAPGKAGSVAANVTNVIPKSSRSVRVRPITLTKNGSRWTGEERKVRGLARTLGWPSRVRQPTAEPTRVQPSHVSGPMGARPSPQPSLRHPT